VGVCDGCGISMTASAWSRSETDGRASLAGMGTQRSLVGKGKCRRKGSPRKR
jgi:hypothetical protein